jgi:polyisoprenoid-binding protein YceI
MMTMKRTLLMLSLLAAAACNNPADNAPAAAVSDPATPEPPSAAPSEPAEPEAAGTLAFNGEGSSIQMVGSKVTGSHDVKVNTFSGDIRLAEGAPLESGSVEVTMQMDSIEADHPKLTKHLKNGDFFLVSEHPTGSFKSTSIQKAAADGATHKVAGDLTLRGVTKRIEFPATIKREGGAVTVDAEFSINRQDFGISYAGMPDDLIRDEVLIKLDLKAS